MTFFSAPTLLALTVAMPLPAIAQTNTDTTRQPDEAPQAPTVGATASTGPKVHTSKARDVTDCSRTVNGGGKAAVGLALGGVLGAKVGGGAAGVLAGSAAGGVVGAEMDKRHRCGPDAKIESNATTDALPPKKHRLGGLRNAMGL